MLQLSNGMTCPELIDVMANEDMWTTLVGNTLNTRVTKLRNVV
ncbi:MAG: hypothetical protein U0796_13660 [Gemmatales bacterium]